MSHNLAEIADHHEGRVSLLWMGPVSALAGLTDAPEPGLEVLRNHNAKD